MLALYLLLSLKALHLDFGTLNPALQLPTLEFVLLLEQSLVFGVEKFVGVGGLNGDFLLFPEFFFENLDSLLIGVHIDLVVLLFLLRNSLFHLKLDLAFVTLGTGAIHLFFQAQVLDLQFLFSELAQKTLVFVQEKRDFFFETIYFEVFLSQQGVEGLETHFLGLVIEALLFFQFLDEFGFFYSSPNILQSLHSLHFLHFFS